MRNLMAGLLASVALAGQPVYADTFLFTDESGRPTARVFADPLSDSFFDVFIDIRDQAGNSFCAAVPPSPCFPRTASATSLTSGEFQAGYFQILFEVSMGGAPLAVTGAGLNQSQTVTNSFFDVFFEVGNGQRAALGFNIAAVNPGPPEVTGLGAIVFPSVGMSPGPPDIFVLDPQAFTTFQITLQPGPFLNLPAPPLAPNPNVVPEPSSLLLLGTSLAGLAAYGRKKRPRKH